MLSLGTALWAGSLACSSTHESAAAGGVAGAIGGMGAAVGGSADAFGGAFGGTAGASANSAGASARAGAGGASGGSPGATGSACAEHPAPERSQGTLLSLSILPVFSGKPFVFGQPNALADGSSVVPTNFRFYVSALQLLRSSGDPLAVDLVTASGEPEPYGVHLFNAEDDDSSTLRVLAPPGEYTGLSFLLGIKLSCNQQPPANLEEPLTDTSQMTWPHTGGFLFLRYEGRNNLAEASTSITGVPTKIHMGGSIMEERVPRVTVSGALSVPQSGQLEKKLSVSLDEIFGGASADIDVSDVAVGLLSSDEAVAGERLRRELGKRQVFVLAP